MSMNVSILGTGDFARALGHRLLSHGYSLTFGSRAPRSRDLTAIDPVFSSNTDITTIEEAIAASDVIFLCIHATNHASALTPIAECFTDKYVIDVSNVERKHKDGETSNAERLAKILPRACVVKAFNTQSAYKLANATSGEGSVVFAASDHQAARERVLQIARTCGFVGVDAGALSKARDLEAMPLNLCGDWLVPLVIFAITFGLWLLWVIWQYGIKHDAWERFASSILNKAYACETLTLLGLTYLPGGIAGFLQIINGTKYKRFPAWLDLWLRARKQLGLLALLLAAMHCIVSVALINSRTNGDLYAENGVTIPGNNTQDVFFYFDSRMNLKGELLIFTGVIATALMAILGITSIPAVGNLLSWRQWVLVQSYVGFVMLCMSEAHVMVKGLKGWTTKDFGDIVTSMTFMSSVVPWLAILLRLILWCPGVNGYLTKIRGGWERVAPQDVETGKAGKNQVGAQGIKYENKVFEETEMKPNEEVPNGRKASSTSNN